MIWQSWYLLGRLNDYWLTIWLILLTDWLTDLLNDLLTGLIDILQFFPSRSSCFITFYPSPVYRLLANPLLIILSIFFPFLPKPLHLPLHHSLSRFIHSPFLPLPGLFPHPPTPPILARNPFFFLFCGTMPLLRPSFHLQTSIKEKQYPNKDWIWGRKTYIEMPH